MMWLVEAASTEAVPRARLSALDGMRLNSVVSVEQYCYRTRRLWSEEFVEEGTDGRGPRLAHIS